MGRLRRQVQQCGDAMRAPPKFGSTLITSLGGGSAWSEASQLKPATATDAQDVPV